MKVEDIRIGHRFICHPESKQDPGKYYHEVVVDEDATIPQMLKAFEMYLDTAGYNLDGRHLVLEDR